jgi:hypothetical protein
MDGLDSSPPKSNGHNPLIATLLTERKTRRHLAQAPQCPSPPSLRWARVPLPSEVTLEHEVSASKS